MAGLFFSDICGTLYRTNTSYSFLSFYFKRNDKIKSIYFSLLLSLPAMVLWKALGTAMDMNWLRNHILALLKGANLGFVEAEARKFVAEILPPLENRSACETARLGSPLILVSATLSPLAKAIADHFDAEAYFATRMETKNGILTGKIASDARGRKLELLSLSSYRLQLADSTFMTDNHEDLPLVKKVKKAIIIAPSRKHQQFWLKQKLQGLIFLKV